MVRLVRSAVNAKLSLQPNQMKSIFANRNMLMCAPIWISAVYFILKMQTDSANSNARGPDMGRFGWIFMPVLLIVVCVGVYELMESAGFIPHRQIVNLFSGDDWITGEIRDCTAVIASAPARESYGLNSAFCAAPNGGQRFTRSMITFWGRTTPHDLIGLSRAISTKWKCAQHEDGIVCHSSR